MFGITPTIRFNLPAVYARAVELGSAVVDGLPRIELDSEGQPRPDLTIPPLVRLERRERLERVKGGERREGRERLTLKGPGGEIREYEVCEEEVRHPAYLSDFGGLRGVRHACDLLCWALSPGLPAPLETREAREQHIRNSDCTPQARGALRSVSVALGMVTEWADKSIRGTNHDSLDSPMTWLGLAVDALWESMSGPQRAEVEHRREHVRRIWPGDAPPPRATRR
jgi:hypothetical protein